MFGFDASVRKWEPLGKVSKRDVYLLKTIMYSRDLHGYIRASGMFVRKQELMAYAKGVL